jgi:hypothetical protein
MLKRAFRSCLAAALVLASVPAFAHRFHAGITDVAYNERTGSTEVVHTLMAHDVEALLMELYQRPFDLALPEDEAVLRKYIEKRFYLLASDKSRLPLRWVGMQLNPESVIIYQEAEKTPLASAVAIHDDLLSDFIPEQANTVNVTENGVLRTLSFDRSKVEQGLR